MKNDLTAEYVKSILNYDSSTGIFVWKESLARSIKIGQFAGTITTTGHVSIKIKNSAYLAHRLAYLIITERWPENQIDHINHVRNDNRWCNLREATQKENSRNRMSAQKNNKLGIKGVYWNKQNKKYQGYIRVNRKLKHLGCFETKEEASLAYNEAAIKYFGEFAKLNEV